jgi:hypothetical protein
VYRSTEPSGHEIPAQMRESRIDQNTLQEYEDADVNLETDRNSHSHSLDGVFGVCKLDLEQSMQKNHVQK